MSSRRADVFFYGLFSQPPSSSERNPDYAANLRAVAQKVGLPAEYVASLK
jgi:hypothetical protein